MVFSLEKLSLNMKRREARLFNIMNVGSNIFQSINKDTYRTLLHAFCSCKYKISRNEIQVGSHETHSRTSWTYIYGFLFGARHTGLLESSSKQYGVICFGQVFYRNLALTQSLYDESSVALCVRESKLYRAS